MQAQCHFLRHSGRQTDVIDRSLKTLQVSATVLNYIVVNTGSHKLAVRFSGIMEDTTVDIEKEFLYLAGTGKRIAV